MHRQAAVLVALGVVLATDGVSADRTASSRAERQWVRAPVTHDPERWPSNRGDWSDDPASWDLRPPATIPDLPPGVRDALAARGCRLPVWRRSPVATVPAVWGAFAQAGQRDLAVICVHPDGTSATYVFWAGDPLRRETVPQSGSSIAVIRPADLEARLDADAPREADMPPGVEHDGLDVGCCECCSTIFYRHDGRWWTIPGSD